MSYKSLEKLFRMDASNDRYAKNEELARQRLNAESTFRTGITTEAGELFLAVPRELSVLNENVLRKERKVSANLRLLPPVARGALIRDLVTSEVVCSNDLEGIHSTRRQISEQLSATQDDPLADKRFGEFAKLYLGLSTPNQALPVEPADIRRIYDSVMAGEPLANGEKPDGRLFRKDRVEIIGMNQEAIHSGAYPEEQIIEYVEQMLGLAHSDEIPETYSAIMSHYVFEYAHPFYDGNGRTGRYLLALFLSRPLSMLTSLSLSRTIAENRGAYYRSFREVENPLNHGELTFFVMNILKNVRSAQDDLVTSIEAKRTRLAAAEQRLAELAEAHNLPRPQTDALDMLIQIKLFGAFPEASLADVSDHVKLGTQQTRKHMGQLEELGLISAKQRRPLMFILSADAEKRLGLSNDG